MGVSAEHVGVPACTGHGGAGWQHEHPLSGGCPRDLMGGNWGLCATSQASRVQSGLRQTSWNNFLAVSHRPVGAGCRRLIAGLALFQEDDSRDRVSPVLGAAASVQSAEALVGCVHGLSLRRHADDRCVWVHAAGKLAKEGALGGTERAVSEDSPHEYSATHCLSLEFSVNKAKIC